VLPRGTTAHQQRQPSSAFGSQLQTPRRAIVDPLQLRKYSRYRRGAQSLVDSPQRVDLRLRTYKDNFGQVDSMAGQWRRINVVLGIDHD